MSFLYAFPDFGSAMTALNSAMESLGERCVHAGLSHKTSAGPLPDDGIGHRSRGQRLGFLARPGEALRVVLDVLAIRSFQQTEADDLSRIIAKDLTDRHEVPEALRHLLPLQRHEAVVHPRPRPVDAPGALADHRF